ncbi:cystathionine gamma-synthase [Niveibacterium umoris]|uniref:Cystathionine gamma-synthase n=1 Tax=Niveibacterium umoris TaxID=1193620 RepID=A0A840BHF4_9RHOO|nr:cystathionine gamma-synthase [Niveibacterium umoris]
MSKDSSPVFHPETLTAQALGRVAEPYRDIVPPLHLSTTFERADDGSYPGGRVYSRDASPAYDQAEALLAELEAGDSALLFSSGMAAAAAVFQALEPGQRVLAPRNMYWALRKWLILFAEQWQLDLAFYENADLADLEAKLAIGAPKLLWIESPANPTWELTDIAAASALAHRAGAQVAVDATVLTPVHGQALKMGADIVMHSATKYLNGHSDVVAGALVARKDAPLWPRIRTVRALGGAVLGPFEAWLLLRGMRTLFPRVRTASASAMKLAEALERHPAVSQVSYPGLPSHPQHALAQRQFSNGFGGMLSVRIRGGESAARAVAAKLRIFKQATSLGSVESLVEHRASVEGPGTFCPDDLLRVSVGIEHSDDLIADFVQALDSIA